MSSNVAFLSPRVFRILMVLMLFGLAAPGCAVDDKSLMLKKPSPDGAAQEMSNRDNAKRFLSTLDKGDVVMVFDVSGELAFFDGETLAPAGPAEITLTSGKTELLNSINLSFVQGSCIVVVSMPGTVLTAVRLPPDHPACKPR